MDDTQRRAIRRILSGQEDEPVTLTTDDTPRSAPVEPQQPTLDAQQVIDALRRQIADLSYQLALAQAQVAALQHERGE